MVDSNGNSTLRVWLNRLLVGALGVVAALIVVLWGILWGSVTDQQARLEVIRGANDTAHSAIILDLRDQKTTLIQQIDTLRINTLQELRGLDQRLAIIQSKVDLLERAISDPGKPRQTP